jgi:hypothetical protein
MVFIVPQRHRAGRQAFCRLGGAEMAERVVVLAANYVDFTDKTTGEVVQGTKVKYFYPDMEAAEGAKGVAIIDEWVRGKNVVPALLAVPGVYELCMKRVPGRGGRPTERIDGFELLQDLRPAFADFAVLEK